MTNMREFNALERRINRLEREIKRLRGEQLVVLKAVMRNIKDKINLIMKDSGISVEELAKVSGVPVNTIKSIPTSDTPPSMEQRKAISDALGVNYRSIWPF